ncbi:branched-chain amino acid ABC transporter permease [Rhizobium pusense]|uniref:branched-chain amino acid ABC transporter permease n=1 Tax=Agrobacterium pusense TaxID=648995 RepID=UPI001FCCD3CB|nr:branched-chain amino acid ABC transporter permease [Agrobacterium pusense]MCJ2877422.1 branched-chain amino acid ABC transporter permease [Agrobacterium pusense]
MNRPASISPAVALPSFEQTLRQKHRVKAWEGLLIPALAVVPLLGDHYYALGTQVLTAIIFALSLDLLVGYAGIVTLGHAAFFGVGAYATGIASQHGWAEPISGLFIGAAVGALAGLVVGAIVVRTSKFTLLMLTLCTVFLFGEIANKATSITGGVDGLLGMETWPILGLFEFDLMGATGYYFSAAVFVCVFLFVRLLVHSPFGQSIMAIRDNPGRAEAIGIAILPRQTFIFVISAFLAGLAGALQAEVNQFVGLKDISFELSATILVMLALGGSGRLFGAIIGPIVYLVAQDLLSKDNPVMWQLWLGIILIALVLFAPGGLARLFARIAQRIGR